MINQLFKRPTHIYLNNFADLDNQKAKKVSKNKNGSDLVLYGIYIHISLSLSLSLSPPPHTQTHVPARATLRALYYPSPNPSINFAFRTWIDTLPDHS